jgi:hypothetical protein
VQVAVAAAQQVEAQQRAQDAPLQQRQPAHRLIWVCASASQSAAVELGRRFFADWQVWLRELSTWVRASAFRGAERAPTSQVCLPQVVVR